MQITVAESIGVEGRGGFYEEAGALRDIVQNHLLQLLTFVAMEPPVSFAAEAVRDENVKVLRARAADAAEPTSCAASTAAGSIDGEPVPGYREEDGVAPDSPTETFVAARLHIDNWRWAGHAVLPAHRQAAAQARHRDRHPVQARAAPAVLVRRGRQLEPNVLVLRVQPDEGITLRFGAKVPGSASRSAR